MGMSMSLDYELLINCTITGNIVKPTFYIRIIVEMSCNSVLFQSPTLIHSPSLGLTPVGIKY